MAEAGAPSPAPAGQGAATAAPVVAPPSEGRQEGQQPKKTPVERPSLPGVVTNTPGEREDFGFDRKRDSRGRFAPGDGGAEDAIERELFGADGDGGSDQPGETRPGEVAPERPTPPEGLEPPKEKFKFAGEEFDSREAAEQNIRSLRGMFKPLQEKLAKTEQDREYGYEGMRRYEQIVSSKDARIAELENQLRSGGATGTQQLPSGQDGQPAAGGEMDDVLSGIDGQAFEQVAVQYGLPTAVKLLAKQIMQANEKIVQARVEATRQELMAQVEPFAQSEQQRQVLAGLQQTHSEITSLKLTNGQPAFPELSDPSTARAVGKVWKDFGNNPADALTPRGMVMAVALYRQVTGWQPQPTPVVPTAQPAAIPAVRSAPAPSASLDADPRGGTPSTLGSQRGARGEAARILSDLDKAATPDPVLGFPRRRA